MFVLAQSRHSRIPDQGHFSAAGRTHGSRAYINKDGKAVGTLNFYTENIKLLGSSTGAPAQKEAEKATAKAGKSKQLTQVLTPKRTIYHFNPALK